VPSNTISFVHSEKIVEICNPNPNETLLNFVRTKLKKLVVKTVARKVDVVLAQLF